MLEIAKVLITLAILVKASVEDIKNREIDDRLWIAMLAFAILFNLIKPPDLKFAILQLIFTFVLANVMYYILRFGGADCKALICLSIMFPDYPQIFNFTVKGLMFPLTVLTNSVMITPLIVLYFFIKNALRGDFAKTMFVGYKVRVDDIPRFHNLLEWVEGEKIVRSLRGIEFDLRLVDELKSKGFKEIWVTPALPFIVFITFGFLAAITIGDVLYLIKELTISSLKVN